METEMDALRKILSSFGGDSADLTTCASANDAASAFAALQKAQTTVHTSGKVEMPGVSNLSGDKFERLLLPWAAFVLNRQGRKSGIVHSATERNLPRAMPDPRIVGFDRRIPDYKRALATKGSA
ncbi:hypothetical protein U8P73_04150 [Rhizobium beringeri]|uniref:hypothetical protein n=1 Tax=Rhizobium beringeri TaxID=3019934 RepID=UPI002DDD334A|nr:hypothetical protein [Rhizobium beringeri]WSG89715.1 hypothetical protein U8P73_04150 [Rhizobium beringeri]